MFGQGISKEGDILDNAAELGIINKSGAWFAYNGSKIGQGRENAKQYLREHAEICQEVERKVREQVLVDESDADEIAEEPKKEEPGKTEAKKAESKKEEAAKKKTEE